MDVKKSRCWHCKWLKVSKSCPDASMCDTPSYYVGTYCVDHNFVSFEKKRWFEHRKCLNETT